MCSTVAIGLGSSSPGPSGVIRRAAVSSGACSQFPSAAEFDVDLDDKRPCRSLRRPRRRWTFARQEALPPRQSRVPHPEMWALTCRPS